MMHLEDLCRGGMGSTRLLMSAFPDVSDVSDQQCVAIQTKTYASPNHAPNVKRLRSYLVHMAPTSRDCLKTHLKILTSQLLVIA